MTGRRASALSPCTLSRFAVSVISRVYLGCARTRNAIARGIIAAARRSHQVRLGEDVMARPVLIPGTIALMLAVAAPALAQETVRVRGAIERVEGDTYVVKT